MTKMYTVQELKEMKMPQLRQIAKELGVKTYRRKADMVAVLSATMDSRRASKVRSVSAKRKVVSEPTFESTGVIGERRQPFLSDAWGTFAELFSEASLQAEEKSERSRIQRACEELRSALADAKAEDLRMQVKAGIITRAQRRKLLAARAPNETM